ncbi:MAG: hypothetical protein V3T28_07200, partial [Gemmatimonadales bacterium]
ASCQRPVTSGYTGNDIRVARVDSEGRECMRSMTDRFDCLKTDLADRHAIERELGAGGMGPQITQNKADARGS